jgi:NADH-quinone oxidoreductase subunit F
MSKNLSSLSFRQNKDTHLFEVLVDAAAQSGTVPVDDMREAAKANLFGESSVIGAVSFYDFLKHENEGKKVFVCNGTACLLAGTQDRLHGQLAKHFEEDEIGEMCCLGRCHENTAFQYQGVNYSAQGDDQIDAIVKNGKKVNGSDDYAVGSNLATPPLTGDYGGVPEVYGSLKDLLERPPEELLAEIIDSKIRGRGGAGFPAGIKWKTCREAPGDKKYIVCNADEGDPGAYTDRYLMEKQPHLVLLGMIVAGYIVGSDTGILYIRGEYPESVQVMRDAVEEIRAAGYIGENICDSGFTFNFNIIQGAGAYICGEETALLASIEGQRPEVRTRPPFPAIEGLYRKPTVVNNVETFALVHPVLKLGGHVFSKIGTEKSSGSKLVSLDSHFKNPGVYEIEMGTPLSAVVYEFGGGFTEPVKALHIGGPLGGLVPKSHIENLTLDFESFAENGFLLGHGSVLAIPETFDMLEYIEHLFAFTAAESCGKCFPCRLGSVRGEELTHKARTSDYKIDRTLLVDLVETMEETSLCALGGGVPLPIRNIMEHFAEELQPYFCDA